MDSKNLDVLLFALNHPELHLERVHCGAPPCPVLQALASRGSFALLPWPKLTSVKDPHLGCNVVALTNVRITPPMLRLFSRMSISLAMSSVGCRKLLDGWHGTKLRLIHSDVGLCDVVGRKICEKFAYKKWS